MSPGSERDLLVLHAVRLAGFTDTPVIAGRFGLDLVETTGALGDTEARGWVEQAAFADLRGWSLTEAGRAENERLLAAELDRAGGAELLADIYREFLPLNARLQRACTEWQLRPTDGDRLAVNDHSDPGWDTRILDELAAIDRALGPLAGRLTRVLERFSGYDTRFSAALRRAQAGEPGWVEGTNVDSCHRVWFELHEDLIATLGIDRRVAI